MTTECFDLYCFVHFSHKYLHVELEVLKGHKEHFCNCLPYWKEMCLYCIKHYIDFDMVNLSTEKTTTTFPLDKVLNCTPSTTTPSLHQKWQPFLGVCNLLLPWYTYCKVLPCSLEHILFSPLTSSHSLTAPRSDLVCHRADNTCPDTITSYSVKSSAQRTADKWWLFKFIGCILMHFFSSVAQNEVVHKAGMWRKKKMFVCALQGRWRKRESQKSREARHPTPGGRLIKT